MKLCTLIRNQMVLFHHFKGKICTQDLCPQKQVSAQSSLSPSAEAQVCEMSVLYTGKKDILVCSHELPRGSMGLLSRTGAQKG